MLGLLYEVSDDRYLPAELKLEGSGLRYRARPRHVQRVRRRVRPARVGQDEVEALLRCARSWRDRFLLVLLWFCGLRIGEALGLRRSDLHLGAASQALGCPVPGAHLHVVSRDGNPNGARAKSGDRHVPVHAEVLACYDHYLAERDRCQPAEECDFVLVNLFHQPTGRPMSDHTVRQWLAQTSRQAALDRVVHPHMFRHATASGCSPVARASTSSKSCWDTSRSAPPRPTCIPTPMRCARRWTASSRCGCPPMRNRGERVTGGGGGWG